MWQLFMLQTERWSLHLLKHLKQLEMEKTVEEKVYGCKSKYSITDETSTAISPESIMVINPFDENAYENQGTLMANETLRRQYIQIYKSIDQSREAMFGKIKASLKYSSRSSFDAESSMLNDWGYTKKDLFLCLKEIENKIKIIRNYNVL